MITTRTIALVATVIDSAQKQETPWLISSFDSTCIPELHLVTDLADANRGPP